MRDGSNAFHLAIPTYDLSEAEHFYVTLLGCKLARHYEDRISVDFFGDQLVCHLVDRPDHAARPTSLYPRHFGVTFERGEAFDAVVRLCALRKVAPFRDLALRFEGRAEEHRTLALCDPSDNVLEFKHYRDPRMMF